MTQSRRNIAGLIARAVPEWEAPLVAGVEKVAAGWEREIVGCVIEHGPTGRRARRAMALRSCYGAESLGMRPKTVERMRAEHEPLVWTYEMLRDRTALTVPEVEALL